jgi:hypothetical protein
MPVIEPIPVESLPPRSQEIVETGMADGLYATSVPLQIFAYSSQILESAHAKRTARGGGTQERMALTFLDLLSADHHAIDANFYRRLSEVFTTAQIVELGFACAEMMGLHRFIHTLDVFGSEPPVLTYSSDQVDMKLRAGEPAGATQ